MGLKYGAKCRAFAFFAPLLAAMAAAILIQVHKLRTGADSFWNVRLLLIALAGTACIYTLGQLVTVFRESTFQGKARAKGDKRLRILIALLLFLVLFVTYKFSLAFGALYRLGPTEPPKIFFSRHNDLTRKMFVYNGKTAVTAAVPFGRAQAVVGYRLEEAAKALDLSSLPLKFKLTLYDENGNVRAGREDILDA
jgi:hypothetical protein